MIVKQVPNRHDGKSDFGELARYITGGISAEEHARAVRERPGFGPLTEYLAQAHGQAAQDKCVAVSLHRIRSVATAAAQFYSVAMRNPNVENPVVHLIVSWPEDERPSYEAIFAAGRDVLKSLNLHEHQWLMAIHNDTDNLHCHIEVSRVHPDTYKSQHLPWMHRTLHRAAREIEIRNGWFHDDGLFVVRTLPHGRKAVVANTSWRDAPDTERSFRGEKAQRMAAWSDRPSLVAYCREMVREEMARLLDAAAGWDAVHRLLGEHGMRVHKTGAGAFQLEAIIDAGGTIRLPISQVLRGIGLGEAERMMGPFTPDRTTPVPLVQPSMSDGRHEGRALPKRNPFSREARRLERAAERSALIGRYRAAQEAAKTARSATREQLAEVAAWCKATIDAQRRQTAAAKNTLFQDEPDPHERQLHRRALTIHARLDRVIVKAEAKARCKIILASRPAPLAWRTWLEAEAQAGDPAALKALRGLVYDAGRKSRRQARAGLSVDLTAAPSLQEGDAAEELLASLRAHEKEEASIRSARSEPARAEQADALLHRICGLTWRVTNNGNVEYRRAMGEPVFVDRGSRLTFDRQSVTDEDLVLAMLHAREKWGRSIVLTGGDAIFVERMVKAAADAGMTVANPKLQPVQARYIALQAQDGKKPVAQNTISARVGPARMDPQRSGAHTGSAPVVPGPAALSGSTAIKTVRTGKRRRR